MRETEARKTIRATARLYEESLSLAQRKKLGQFFTGSRLSKLLAHLALSSGTRTVLDPMVGHGDLLDGTWEAASERRIALECLDGIEVDNATAAICITRLNQIISSSELPEQHIIAADAFEPRSLQELRKREYDLVITNPPYIRYQTRNVNGANRDHVRNGLIASIDSHLSGVEKDIWKALAQGYSGLSDLSIPAWLLAALLVKPGGRLALVVPATWRSRDYADVVQYILLRCFSTEYIIEDTQPGWFSDAFVRTHLIVARRLHSNASAVPLKLRTEWPSAHWLQISPEAADENSLIGTAFPKNKPEAEFAAWAHGKCKTPKHGINVHDFPLLEEWISLAARIHNRDWYQKLEGSVDGSPFYTGRQSITSMIIPKTLKDLLPDGLSLDNLYSLEDAGIQVGQGLRTGCNQFFYVTACGPSVGGRISIETSSLFGHDRFTVPVNAVRPVLRRQSEMESIKGGNIPAGRVLDLHNWVLPEDFAAVNQAKPIYAMLGRALPQIMPDGLAAYVRRAVSIPLEVGKNEKKIPELSAVCTNVRHSRNTKTTPRFWYMLPDFTCRHLPAAFVPRINHGLPWVESNCDPAILIDANFSSFWSLQKGWTCYALKALLNSAWCRAFMETLGTPFGGGALKLEATHLRRILIPVLPDTAKAELNEAGKQLTRNAIHAQARIDEIILETALSQVLLKEAVPQLAKAITDHAHNMSCARQRAA